MKKYSLILLLFALLASCSSEKKEKQPVDKIGKYLYQDQSGTLHVNDGCVKFWTEDETTSGVKRIPSNGFDPDLLDNTCPICVNDDIFDVLQTMAGEPADTIVTF